MKQQGLKQLEILMYVCKNVMADVVQLISYTVLTDAMALKYPYIQQTNCLLVCKKLKRRLYLLLMAYFVLM